MVFKGVYSAVFLIFLTGAVWAADTENVERIRRQMETVESAQRLSRSVEVTDHSRIQEVQEQSALSQVKEFANKLAEHGYDVNANGKIDEEDVDDIDYGYESALDYADSLSEEDIKLMDQDSDAEITDKDREMALENVKKLLGTEMPVKSEEKVEAIPQ